MAVVSTPNASSVKVKFDQGANVDGDRIIKTNIMAVVNALVGLQKHTLSGVNRVDNTSLSE